MSNRYLIVTIALGTSYRELWQKYCQANWRKYADANGCDLMCIDTPLDNSERAQRRSASWQKCLILSQPWSDAYERIIWLDADILINTNAAPWIAEGVPADKVGGVAAFSTPSRPLYLQAMERAYAYWDALNIPTIREYTPLEYYTHFGLEPLPLDEVVQGGVLVLAPSHHRQLLEKIYYEYEDKGSPHWHYEMRPLSYELLKADCVHWLDFRFNQIWTLYELLYYPFLLQTQVRAQQAEPQHRIARFGRKVANVVARRSKQYVRYSVLQRACATTAFFNGYFLHFASSRQEMELVDLNAGSWQELAVR